MPSIDQQSDVHQTRHDDLLDDEGIEAFLRDLAVPDSNANPTLNDATSQNRSASNPNGSGADLGLDDEVKIGKKKQPIAKLDEDRILSAKGIPQLRKVTKDRLKFKGKGHEFSDVARMLSMYQLWLDDLYPRAKFLDGLSMVEKLGHKKRLQVMRKQWIDEGKPRLASAEDDEMEDHAEVTQQEHDPIFPDLGNPDEQPGAEERAPRAEGLTANGPDDDELDALITADSESQHQSLNPPRSAFDQSINQDKAADGPDEDELDALLAEEHSNPLDQTQSLFGNGTVSGKAGATRVEDEYADEMEAMAGMDD